VDKTNLKTKVFHIKYDKEESQNIINRFKLLHKYLTSNILPKPEAKTNKEMAWMCKYCEYKDKCSKIA